jgi:hypothetical protein
MGFDAHTIELAATAAGPDAMQALGADYQRKILRFFGAWIIAKKVEVWALDDTSTPARRAAVLTLSGPERSVFEAIRQLPGFQIDRADFEGLPIFDFDTETYEVPARASRLRFGDTWLVWKRATISIPMEMLYRVNISTGPHWE